MNCSPVCMLYTFPALTKKWDRKKSPNPPLPGRNGRGVYRWRPPAQYTSPPRALPVHRKITCTVKSHEKLQVLIQSVLKEIVC